MTEQEFSPNKKRFKLPNLKESVYVMRTLPFLGKVVFLFLSFLFLISSMLLVWNLNDRFLVTVPELGGSLNEGIVGAPRFINPLIAITDAERDLSALIYSGLMRPDNKGGLIPDLAEKYEISPDGLTYTFTLRPNLFWHDGEKVTTDDIIFTIQRAKDPILKSTKRASWEGVSIEKVDDKIIKFTLKKQYAPFLENTTLGILPKHLWQNVPSEQMLYSGFNTNPVGSGPYKVKSVSKDSSGNVNAYTLEPNSKFPLSGPYLKLITLNFYLTEKDAITAFKNKNISSISGVSPSQMSEIITNCSDNPLCDQKNYQLKTLNLPRIFAVFFNQNKSKALLQKEVRQALELATDRNQIINDVLKGYGKPLQHPIPDGTLGALPPEPENFSIDAAKNLLAKNGWKPGQDGVLEKQLSKKETIKLEIEISTSADSDELKSVAVSLGKTWQQIGAKVETMYFETGDLQKAIAERNYQALLFGESVGHDPDPFAFWHSSQKDYPGANIALYTNSKVDKLLEDARKTLDRDARADKYKQFQDEISKDIPAIFLFSPTFIYVLPKDINGVGDVTSVSSPSERFAQVYKWYTYTNKIWKFFAK